MIDKQTTRLFELVEQIYYGLNSDQDYEPMREVAWAARQYLIGDLPMDAIWWVGYKGEWWGPFVSVEDARVYAVTKRQLGIDQARELQNKGFVRLSAGVYVEVAQGVVK